VRRVPAATPRFASLVKITVCRTRGLRVLSSSLIRAGLNSVEANWTLEAYEAREDKKLTAVRKPLP
jgi:hypothetical protein